MTDNTTPPQSTNRWYTFLGFQFSRRQVMRAAKLLAAGGLAFCVAFAAWYIPPRATSRLIRSVGGYVRFRDEQVPNMLVARFFHQQTSMIGLTATDEEVEEVQLDESTVSDTWLHHLKPLVGLKTLQIHERQLGPGLAELAGLPTLSDISIEHFCSGDLNHIQQLPNLTGVSLLDVACPDIDLSKLASLTQLQTLQFHSASISARQLEQISQLKTLNVLYIIPYGKTDAARTEGIEHLAKLPALRILDINDATDETAATLAKIESLTLLKIREPSLTDKGAASLAKLPNLLSLDLRGSTSPIDIEALRKQMPRCRINYSVRQTPTR